MKLFDFNDIHSHIPGNDRVLSVDFTNPPAFISPDQHITIGIHPWNAQQPFSREEFEKNLDNPMVVGIGEAGLDSLRGPSMEQQMEVFLFQLEMAQKHHLPVVIHSVRNNHNILALKKKLKPTVPWVIHGFRGNVKQAHQLLDAGIHISLGPNANAQVKAIDSPLVHHETDEETIPQRGK